MDSELMNIADIVIVLDDILNVLVVLCILISSLFLYITFHNAVKK